MRKNFQNFQTSNTKTCDNLISILRLTKDDHKTKSKNVVKGFFSELAFSAYLQFLCISSSRIYPFLMYWYNKSNTIYPSGYETIPKNRKQNTWNNILHEKTCNTKILIIYIINIKKKHSIWYVQCSCSPINRVYALKSWDNPLVCISI